MKKAVITTGGKQYLVAEGQEFEVELLPKDEKSLVLEAMLVIDGDSVKVGTPIIDGTKVNIEVVESEVKADKVTAIRYKAKKRVHKLHGHRQKLTRIKIAKIV